jgi:hypothetical protein
MDFALIFEKLFPDENVSPCVAGSYGEIMSTWRGSRPIPSQAECQVVWDDILRSNPALREQIKQQENRVLKSVSKMLAPLMQEFQMSTSSKLVLVYAKPKGVGMTYPEGIERLKDETDPAYAARVGMILTQVVLNTLNGVVYTLTTEDKLPPLKWKDAWKITPDLKLVVDIDRAREKVWEDAVVKKNELKDAAMQKIMGLFSTGTDHQRAQYQAYMDALESLPTRVKNDISKRNLEELEAYNIPYPVEP